jgi:hypothetical protein
MREVILEHMNSVRRFADNIGIDPWDVSLDRCASVARTTESRPQSRFFFGSPCRFVRSIDYAVHIVLPEMVEERHPMWACYLRTTSPRWGKAWRDWSTPEL